MTYQHNGVLDSCKKKRMKKIFINWSGMISTIKWKQRSAKDYNMLAFMYEKEGVRHITCIIYAKDIQER